MRLRASRQLLSAVASLSLAACLAFTPPTFANADEVNEGEAAAIVDDSADLALAVDDGSDSEISALALQSKVATPSQADIRKMYQAKAKNAFATPTYASKPKATAPYAFGALSQATLNNAIDMLNYIRYVAGIPSNVTLNDSYNESAQAAALVNAANYATTGTFALSHYPSQPSGMSTEMYQKGYDGAGKSNLAAGCSSPAQSLTMYMDDSDSGNIARVGHRRWCLNPTMTATGFGFASGSETSSWPAFSAMYSLDGSSMSVPYEAVVWPAANMPTNLFYNAQAWSASLDLAPYGGSIDKVTLTRKADGKVWTITDGSSQGELYNSINSSSGFVGSGSCVIFRPKNISYSAGDSFAVTLTGANGKTYSYSVDFFDVDSSVSKPSTPGQPTSPNTPGSSSNAQVQTMHRLYNPNSGEHFYTANVGEANNLVSVGWAYEGVAWKAPKKSKTPVYRLYSGTDHHYTTKAAERDMLVAAGWIYEDIGWYSDDAQGVPLYRQFNPNVQPWAPVNNSGSHNYTTSKVENDQLVRVGWHEEGIGWYGCK